ncbi:uncharacterized protein LOC132050669 [Lycium ferocissimum]|uniref:uncharacterized protein LOC132050669 n=1 Tax=Lycium ferocissimum TaxID=112874 RepID=UPI002815D596|nr:uncharacterized protein LOC132050669 [Lycium ferocissimum]
MAKNYQSNTNDSQFKKIFKWDNRKQKSPSSAIEIKGKSKSTMASGSGPNMVPVDYNHTPGKVQQKQEIKGNKSSDSNNNDSYFSSYIDRVKNKMRTTTSSVGVDDGGGAGTIRKPVKRRDSLNDRVSHYINRTKVKIRTTTIVNRGDRM